MQGTGGKARSVGASKDWWDVDEHTGGSVGASEDWRDVDERTDKSEVQGSGGKACKEVGGQVLVTVCIWPVVLGFEQIPRVLHMSSESA